jgi:hypothetical protein
MGMFNDIEADLVCPVNRTPTPGMMIQIKWQDHNSLYLRVYKIGEELEDILSKYDNRWVRVFYGCPACSTHTTSEDSAARRVVESDEGSHYAFVEMRNGVIRRVIGEKEFAETGVKEFANYW